MRADPVGFLLKLSTPAGAQPKGEKMKFYLCDDKSENFYIGKRSFPELNKATAEKASLLAVGDFLDLGNGMALQRYA